MNFSFHAAEIPINEIDLASEAFLLSPKKGTEVDRALADSIGRVGILSPPILMPRDTDSYQIVTGWKRLAVWQERFGEKPLCCLVMKAATREEECLAIAMEDIMRHRAPTAVEIAIFFKKTGRHLDRDRIAERFLPILGLPKSPTAIERYLSILELEDPIIMAVHDGRLSERTAFELVRHSMRDRLAVFEFVDRLQLSVSNQKKFLTGVAELAGRHKTSMMNILANPEPLAILDHPTANVPQQTAMLMSWLDRQRFPRMHQAEIAFRQLKKELQLPKEMTLEHALSFERDTLTLSISFADVEGLRNYLPEIRDILSKQ